MDRRLFFYRSVVRRPAPSSFVLDILKLLREVLALQPIDDFVWAYIEAHVRPVVQMIPKAYCNRNLPAWKFLDKLMKFFDDVPLQHREIANKNYDFWMPAIVSVNCEITLRLVGQEIRLTKALHQLLYARV